MFSPFNLVAHPVGTSLFPRLRFTCREAFAPVPFVLLYFMVLGD
jgi:hypothetical protein